jgi:hypothetical protein
MTEPKVVVIPPLAEDGRRLWVLLLSMAGEFGPDREWSLIGGLMVQLHAFEQYDGPRPTADIDLLGGAKRSPRMTEAMASLLVERGAEIAEPPRSNPDLGYRFEFEGETVELLGPDGLRSDPKTIGGLTTFQAAGGSQALRRTEGEDLVRLLSYVEDPRVLAAGMSRKEPGWLRDAQAAIDFEDPTLSAQFRGESLDRARQALRILAQEPSYSESSTK